MTPADFGLLEFSADFAMEPFLAAISPPEWMIHKRIYTRGTATTKNSGKVAAVANPEFVAIQGRIADQVVIDAEKYRIDGMSKSLFKKTIGPKNQKIEHIVLTSSVIPIRDVLTFLYWRRRGTREGQNKPKPTESET